MNNQAKTPPVNPTIHFRLDECERKLVLPLDPNLADSLSTEHSNAFKLLQRFTKSKIKHLVPHVGRISVEQHGDRQHERILSALKALLQLVHGGVPRLGPEEDIVENAQGRIKDSHMPSQTFIAGRNHRCLKLNFTSDSELASKWTLPHKDLNSGIWMLWIPTHVQPVRREELYNQRRSKWARMIGEITSNGQYLSRSVVLKMGQKNPEENINRSLLHHVVPGRHFCETLSERGHE